MSAFKTLVSLALLVSTRLVQASVYVSRRDRLLLFS